MYSILDYQRLDSQLRKIDKQLNESDDKRKGRQLNAFLKDAEENLRKMEERSRDLNQLLSNLSSKYAEQESIISEYEKQVDKSLDLDEINYLGKKMQDLQKNLSVIEKNLYDIMKEIDEIIKKYDYFSVRVPQATQQYRECREKFDRLVAENKPEIDSIKQKLRAMEKDMDPELLEKFAKLKSQGVYPPFVPLVGANRCGGCQMDNPSSSVANMATKGYMVCENCHRIIYKAKED